MRTIRIGAGAGYSGDRIEPAVELAAKGHLDYLVFECLAERTIALAQQAKLNDPASGFDPLLIARMKAVLPICREKGIRIITNMGAANPATAAQAVRDLKLGPLRIAAVEGDDVLANFEEPGLISANAYLGAGPIVEALANGAQVVITGRVGDPALFAAPLIHEFGWSMTDWDILGKATAIGHLLECAGQVTGGYFADPGYKDVHNLARLGFPLAIVDETGDGIITKVPGSGGEVTVRTCTEQLLYELHDPANYYQPDVIADFSGVTLTQIAPDQVAVAGATGRPKTGQLKVSIGYRDGYLGEGQISYAGPGAAARAQLAIDIVRERFALTGLDASELRFDIIGGERIRITGRTTTKESAAAIGNEVESLWVNGPAGGGGATKQVREVIAVKSALIPEASVQAKVIYYEAP